MQKITFIVIAKNKSETLKRCLLAINRQSYKRKEVIVVDDGSLDHTREIAKQFVYKLVVNHKPKGIAISRKTGLKNATGRIIFFIDGDIELKGDITSRIVDILNRNKNIVALSGKYLSSNQTWNWNRILDARRELVYLKNNKSFKYGLSDATTFSGGFCAIDFRKIGENQLFIPEEGRGGEDLIFQVKLLNEGQKFMYFKDFKGLHLHHRSFLDLIKKMNSEAKGAVWVSLSCLERGFELLSIESIFTVPIIIVLGIFSRNWLIFSFAFLFEYFIYLLPLLLLPKWGIFERIGLFWYAIFYSLIKTFYAIQALVFPGYRTATKILFLRHMAISDLQAKFNWLRRVGYLS